MTRCILFFTPIHHDFNKNPAAPPKKLFFFVTPPKPFHFLPPSAAQQNKNPRETKSSDPPPSWCIGVKIKIPLGYECKFDSWETESPYFLKVCYPSTKKFFTTFIFRLGVFTIDTNSPELDFTKYSNFP